MEGPHSNDIGKRVEKSRRFTTVDAFKAHFTLALGLALCGVAFWFEIGRAEGGNALSWAYVFEWPLLAIFAVYMWWKILHPEITTRQRRREKPAIDPEYEGMLAAWQDHQRELERSQRTSAPPQDSDADESPR